MKARPSNLPRLHVSLRPGSVAEYPEFYEDHVRRLSHVMIERSGADLFKEGGDSRTFSSDVGTLLGAEARHRLIVTGEHCDQIFGSIKLTENPEWTGKPAAALAKRGANHPHTAQMENA